MKMKMATAQFPEVWYQINDGTSGFSEYNTLRGLRYQSSVEEFCESYGDFKIAQVYKVRSDSGLQLLPSEQWKGLTLKEFSSKNPDMMKKPLFIEFGVQKQGDTWSMCTRNRFTDEEPVEDVTEYWMDVTIENGKVESIYFITYYLGERDLDALYAQIQEERGLTASN